MVYLLKIIVLIHNQHSKTMRFFSIISFLLFFLIKASAQTIDISVTEIKEVKVFFQGAEILRKFKLTVPSGKTEVRILNISSAIDPNSIVVSANLPVKIVSLYEELDYENKLKSDEKLNVIKDSIEDLQEKLKYKELQYEALEAEKKTLLQNSVRISSVNQGLAVNEIDQTSAYIRKKQEEINTLLLQKSEEKRKLKRMMHNLKVKQKKMAEKDSSSVANIYLLVESSSQQNVEFTLTYYVKSCGWTPTYNIYSKGAGSPLILEYKANVLNNSGEDWNKIKLSLLAGNPSRSLTLPNMETWVLSYTQKKKNGKVYGFNQSGNEGTLSKKQIKNGQTNNFNAPEVQEIEIEEGEMQFNIEGTHTILSGKRDYLLDISQNTLEASYIYQTIPKIDAKAYLIAKVKDWETLKLIEGDANVFLNETYVGRTYIDPLSAGDTLDLSLGTDPTIQITRVKKKDFNTRKLIGLQLVESFIYEIDVRNLNTNSIQIEVFDQIPIAQQEEIQISLEDKSGASYKESIGKLSWKLEIPAMQTSKLKMGYSVKYPRDKIVIIKRTGKVMCPKFR
jgi:uncharacterized protein (TIGR02231 family)